AQPTDTAKAILSYKGALLKHHLNGGVRKGALTQEQADAKFAAWLEEKDAKLTAKTSGLADTKAAAKAKALEAEKEVNAKRIAAAAEAKAIAEAPVETEAEVESPAIEESTEETEA